MACDLAFIRPISTLKRTEISQKTPSTIVLIMMDCFRWRTGVERDTVYTATSVACDWAETEPSEGQAKPSRVERRLFEGRAKTFEGRAETFGSRAETFKGRATDKRTDRRANQPTDTVTHRAAYTRLKRTNHLLYF